MPLRNLYFIYFCIDGADVDVDDVFASGDVVVDVVDNFFVNVKLIRLLFQFDHSYCLDQLCL